MILIPLADLPKFELAALVVEKVDNNTFSWKAVTKMVASNFHDQFFADNLPNNSALFILRVHSMKLELQPIKSVAGICIFRKNSIGECITTSESLMEFDDNWVEFFRADDKGSGYFPEKIIEDGLENTPNNVRLFTELFKY